VIAPCQLVPLLLVVGGCEDAVLDDHYSLVQFLQSIEGACLLPPGVDPQSAQERKVVFQLIPQRWVLVVDLHAP
jgi:hypothetical protein